MVRDTLASLTVDRPRSYLSVPSPADCTDQLPPPLRPLPPWKFLDYLGWEEQGDGKLAYGIFVQNGRLKGDMKAALRTVRYSPGIFVHGSKVVSAERYARPFTAYMYKQSTILSQVIERYELPVRITANQNLLLLDIEPVWKADIISILGAPPHSSSLVPRS